MFTWLSTKLEIFFSAIEKASNTVMIEQLAILISVTLMITLMIKGYQTLFGLSSDPIRELMWDMLKKFVIISFALNINGYFDIVKMAMLGLHDWASGGENLYVELDKAWTATIKLSTTALQKGSPTSLWLDGLLAMLIILISFFVASLPAFFLILITDFTLKIILMIAPFIIFAMLYGWLKNMFTQWLNIFFANILTVLLINLSFSIIVNQISTFIVNGTTDLNSNKSEAMTIAFEFFALSLLFIMIIFLIKGIAEKIATVSMEGLVNSPYSQVKKFFKG